MGVRPFMVEEINQREDDRGTEITDVRRMDTGEIVATGIYSLASCGVPGAMFWWDVREKGADERRPEPYRSTLFESGPTLCVILPNKSFWNIDSRASNCTMPFDYDHRCWIRHGDPPNITVDKAGKTCEAGAGSIQSGDYHGFLHDGEFTD